MFVQYTEGQPKPNRCGRELTTSLVLGSRQCQKRLWLATHGPRETADGGRDAREGERLGQLARALNGPGVLISADRGMSHAMKDTAAALKGDQPIYEATIEAGGVLTRLDILRPVQGGWDLVEVKSGTEPKQEYLEYMAIQAYVCQSADVAVRRYLLALVDSEFSYQGQGSYDGLLIEHDVTAQVMELQREAPIWIAKAQSTLLAELPTVEPGRFCKSPRPCEFHSECLKEAGIEYPVEILPNAWQRIDALRVQGYRDLCRVPDAALTATSHQVVQQTSKTGVTYRDPELAAKLSGLAYPRYYLDFETIAYAVPKWVNTKPHQAIPFQWSLHIEKSSGELNHREYLSASDDEPRQGFISTLLDALGTSGPIIVYSSFEQARLKELAEAFPDRADEIMAVVARLVDLLPIVRNGFYAASMKGSFSIKKVLPALAPEVSYDNLDGVANGSEAMEAFDRLLELDPETQDHHGLKRSMLAYCRLDTYAMLAVTRRLMDPSCDLPLDH